jgi:hypothetical protein
MQKKITAQSHSRVFSRKNSLPGASSPLSTSSEADPVAAAVQHQMRRSFAAVAGVEHLTLPLPPLRDPLLLPPPRHVLASLSQ